MKAGKPRTLRDVDEQTRAFTARYNLIEGEATKLGAPLSIRLGLELNF